MNTQEPLVRYYARRASEYERVYQKPERQVELQQLRGFVERTFAGADVLEVACGTGYWTEVLARSTASVVATDITEEVLAIARSKNLGPKVTLQREDAYALPHFSRRFNGGLSAFWWSHIPRARLRAFLGGFHQVLVPGAKVVFMDNVYAEGSSTPTSRMDEHGDSFQLRQLDDGSTHEVLKNFWTQAELSTAVEALATEVQIEFWQYYWIMSYRTVSDRAPRAPRAEPS
jgi:demethylmenaquinone methyltransferase/2-methoxy-6-polyprenyl-1,4-benzoquinol methylase